MDINKKHYSKRAILFSQGVDISSFDDIARINSIFQAMNDFQDSKQRKKRRRVSLFKRRDDNDILEKKLTERTGKTG